MKLSIYQGQNGQAFFDGNALIKYVHENDGDWRGEYFNSILKHFDIEVEEIDYLNDMQNWAFQEHKND